MFLRRSATIMFSALVIFTSMASCSIPGFDSKDDNKKTTLGVVKKDPTVSKAFGSISSIVTSDGSKISNGLKSLSTTSIIQNGYNSYFTLTEEKGVFHTQNGGQSWTRKYVVEPSSYYIKDDKKVEKNQEQLRNERIKLNDSLKVTAISSDISNNILYLATKEGSKAKIYSSKDNGETFKELYNGVSDQEINFIANSPTLADNIFASFTNNSIVHTLDQGESWKRATDVDGDIVKLGYVGDKLYSLLEDEGMAYYQNSQWSYEDLKTESGKIITNIKNIDVFSTSDSDNPIAYLLVADKKVWISLNSDLNFKAIDLPLSNDKNNISTVEGVFDTGSNSFSQIWVASDSSLYQTLNQGNSWKTNNQLGLDDTIGNISDFLIDKDDSQVYYMTLSKEVKKSFGFWR